MYKNTSRWCVHVMLCFYLTYTGMMDRFTQLNAVWMHSVMSSEEHAVTCASLPPARSKLEEET